MSGIRGQLIRGRQWILRIAGTLLVRSIPALRRAMGEGSPPRVPEGVSWQPVDAGGVHCEWLSPTGAPANALVLHLHGGGGVLGLYNSERRIASHIALACKLRALLPDYRLGPEDPFPAGLNDCVAVYRWLLSNRLTAVRIILAGDSAGGYLTLSTLLRLRDSGDPLPAAAVCISPNTDPTCNGGTMRTNVRRDAILSPTFASTLMRQYIGNCDLHDPYLSPLIADLHGLPPILIQVGADEILLDDSRRFSERAKAAGVDVTLEIWPHMWHVWHSCAPALPEANEAIEGIAEFAGRHLRMRPTTRSSRFGGLPAVAS